jgi:predicted nucleotidyltransferase
MIYLEERHKQMVRDILKQYPYPFYVFGSRVKNQHKKFSDLDLAFTSEIPLSVQAHIEEDFENSDLPFTVDLVDYNRSDEDFKKVMQSQWELFE